MPTGQCFPSWGKILYSYSTWLPPVNILDLISCFSLLLSLHQLHWSYNPPDEQSLCCQACYCQRGLGSSRCLHSAILPQIAAPWVPSLKPAHISSVQWVLAPPPDLIMKPALLPKPHAVNLSFSFIFSLSISYHGPACPIINLLCASACFCFPSPAPRILLRRLLQAVGAPECASATVNTWELAGVYCSTQAVLGQWLVSAGLGKSSFWPSSRTNPRCKWCPRVLQDQTTATVQGISSETACLFGFPPSLFCFPSPVTGSSWEHFNKLFHPNPHLRVCFWGTQAGQRSWSKAVSAEWEGRQYVWLGW